MKNKIVCGIADDGDVGRIDFATEAVNEFGAACAAGEEDKHG
jgi:hypothetical protein